MNKVERLINLTVALLETRRPLTLNEIRDRVGGYDHDDPESSRRMFERDKDDLRRRGIPIETLPLDAFESEWGYRIDPETYSLPPVELTRQQAAALAIAVNVTGESSLRLGLAKVAARAPDPLDPQAPPARIELGLGELADIAAALIDRRRLTFDYRTAHGESSRRHVDPYGIVHRSGSWYVVGRDHDRQAVRAFRLDRITSAPRAEGEPGAYEVPDGLDLPALVSGPATEGVDARVAVRPSAVWEAVRGGGSVVEELDDGRSVVAYRGADRYRLVTRILALGSDAEVLAPDELRDEIRGRLVGTP